MTIVVGTFGPATPAREVAERELEARRVPFPAQAHRTWSAVSGAESSVLFVAYDAERMPLAALGGELFPLRSLPGHLTARLTLCGGEIGTAVSSALVEAAVTHLRTRRRVIRCRLRVVSPESCEEISTAHMERLGFIRDPAPESYQHTAMVDLTHSPAEILASFSRSARQNIREVEKRALSIRPLLDQSLGRQVEALMREAFTRTGGPPPTVPWPHVITLARGQTGWLRLIGLFHSDSSRGDSLLAFALAVHHGRTVEYLHGASTRDHDLGRVSLNYALQWDLISWARASGARWYDMGGVSSPHSPDAEALRGIDEFKRAFASAIVEVGAEYEATLRPALDRIARLGSHMRHRFFRTGR